MNVLPQTVEIITKMLPLELSEDGNCHVTIRQGYINENDFILIRADSIIIPKVDMDIILDSLPENNKTRREDLSFAIFEYINTNGLL